MTKQYTLKRTATVPTLNADWDAPVWQQAITDSIDHLVRSDSGFQPKSIKFRLLHDEDAMYGIFRVEDQYVQSVVTEFQGSVCRDSCCEIFFQPTSNGYFNLEMNAGGNFLLYYIRDCSRGENGGFKDYTVLPLEHWKMVSVKTDKPSIITPEITTPTNWTVQFAFPRALMEIYAGPLGQFSGQTWKGNLYKCADKCSHPCWVCWNPIPYLSHHLPEYYAPFIME